MAANRPTGTATSSATNEMYSVPQSSGSRPNSPSPAPALPAAEKRGSHRVPKKKRSGSTIPKKWMLSNSIEQMMPTVVRMATVDERISAGKDDASRRRCAPAAWDARASWRRGSPAARGQWRRRLMIELAPVLQVGLVVGGGNHVGLRRRAEGDAALLQHALRVGRRGEAVARAAYDLEFFWRQLRQAARHDVDPADDERLLGRRERLVRSRAGRSPTKWRTASWVRPRSTAVSRASAGSSVHSARYVP